jgi:hypothetical protein
MNYVRASPVGKAINNSAKKYRGEPNMTGYRSPLIIFYGRSAR